MADSTHPARVIARRDGTLLLLTLDNRNKRNALTWAMYDQLEQALGEAATDQTLRVVMITSAGHRAFAAGTDISQFQHFDGDRGIRYEERVGRVLDSLRMLPVPVIAAVPGLAVGAGLMLAAASDLVVAAEDTRFGAPIARTLGNTIDASAIALLRRRVGPAWTDRMLLAGDLVTAVDLAPTGFITRLLPAGTDPRPAAVDLARAIDSHAPLTIRALKQSSRRLDTNPDADTADLVSACYGSRDFTEGVAAFLDRRPPRWEGR
jgi:enoyl-CoA hydratase